jgi:hypothetical protein
MASNFGPQFPGLSGFADDLPVSCQNRVHIGSGLHPMPNVARFLHRPAGTSNQYLMILCYE